MWIFFVRTTFDGFLEAARLTVENNLVAAPLLRRMWWHLEEHDMDLYYKVCAPTGSHDIMLSGLNPTEYRKVYGIIKKSYEDFMAGRDSDFVGKPEDERWYDERVETFNKYMNMLESDPRLQDPPPDLPKRPEGSVRTKEEEAAFEESMKELFAKIERRRKRAEAIYGKKQEG